MPTMKELVIGIVMAFFITTGSLVWSIAFERDHNIHTRPEISGAAVCRQHPLIPEIQGRVSQCFFWDSEEESQSSLRFKNQPLMTAGFLNNRFWSGDLPIKLLQ